MPVTSRTVDDAAGHGGDAPLPAPQAASDGGRMLALAVFDTEVRLHAYAPDDADPCDPAVRTRLDAALAACGERCRFFERHLSRTRPDSDLSRAHAAAPAPVAVAPETAELVRLALGYGARSRGRFDITMGTVAELWDFRRGIVPSRSALLRALAHVDAVAVSVGELPPAGSGEPPRPALALADPEAVLDLGGIAKGYIADDLAHLLTARGIGRFALNLGGNVLVAGGRPGTQRGTGDGAAQSGDGPVLASRPGADPAPADPSGAPWRIGIADPFASGRTCAVVAVRDGSVVTSAAHERRFVRGGRAYHHILDPRDGMPARTDAASATIVSARSLDGDGYSTTVFMLGVAEGLAFVEELPGIEAVIVDDAGRVRWTAGLEGRVTVTPPRVG